MKTSTKVSALILSLMPGLGQILTGRYWRGMVLFFSLLIFVDLALIILPCVWGYTQIRDISLALLVSAGIVWLYNMVDILRIIWWRERRSFQEKKKPLFQEALALYLRNDLGGALKKFRQILGLDRDDSDALFYVGMVFKNQAKLKRARRYFTRCLLLDETEKWSWEVEQELAP